ncbi:unnamed protein product [Ectocarpus sp. CCAP 1310/34]|nr:unnamed protein product [Ectocarpus sp. CCAP 1310/34]
MCVKAGDTEHRNSTSSSTMNERAVKPPSDVPSKRLFQNDALDRTLCGSSSTDKEKMVSLGVGMDAHEGALAQGLEGHQDEKNVGGCALACVGVGGGTQLKMMGPRGGEGGVLGRGERGGQQ